jgi:hypothetical protein
MGCEMIDEWFREELNQIADKADALRLEYDQHTKAWLADKKTTYLRLQVSKQRLADGTINSLALRWFRQIYVTTKKGTPVQNHKVIAKGSAKTHILPLSRFRKSWIGKHEYEVVCTIEPKLADLRAAAAAIQRMRKDHARYLKLKAAYGTDEGYLAFWQIAQDKYDDELEAKAKLKAEAEAEAKAKLKADPKKP